MHRRVDSLDRAARVVGDRADDAGEPAAAREDAALHVDGVGAARLAQALALGRIVDEDVAAENDAAARPADAEARSLPERRAGLVDHARRVEDVADLQLAERPGEPERDEAPLRDAVRDADAHAYGAQAEALRHALFRSRRHCKRQPVSVHARLRTVSFRLLEASYAADGSNPQWMPQCSQRGSLPGPYASHSIPSSSASYVGKMPSVSR